MKQVAILYVRLAIAEHHSMVQKSTSIFEVMSSHAPLCGVDSDCTKENTTSIERVDWTTTTLAISRSFDVVFFFWNGGELTDASRVREREDLID